MDVVNITKMKCHVNLPVECRHSSHAFWCLQIKNKLEYCSSLAKILQQ